MVNMNTRDIWLLFACMVLVMGTAWCITMTAAYAVPEAPDSWRGVYGTLCLAIGSRNTLERTQSVRAFAGMWAFCLIGVCILILLFLPS